MNILMTQVGSLGDCLLTTTIARQIKEVDYPGCHLTWLVGDMFAQVLVNNPHVDEVVPIPLPYENGAVIRARRQVPDIIDGMFRDGRRFDKVFTFDLGENSPQDRLAFGTFRSIYFRIYLELYRRRVTVAPEPVLVLGKDEVAKVAEFVARHGLNDGACYPVLIECEPRSMQSKMNSKRALALAGKLVEEFPKVTCILSRKEPLKTGNSRIIDASELSYRENAELLRHCQLLVGANSGITWLNASTWAKEIPMVQNVSSSFNNVGISYSVEMDYRSVGASTENLIELDDADDDTLHGCVKYVLTNSFQEAKKVYPERAGSMVDYLAPHYLKKRFGRDTISDGCRSQEFTKTKYRLFGFIPVMTVRKTKRVDEIK